MKLSARNVFRGRVVAVHLGEVNAEVTVELAGGLQIVSVITKDSAGRLGLAAGKEVHAIVKASSVMIATE